MALNALLPSPAAAHDPALVYAQWWPEATDHQITIYNRESSGLKGAYHASASSAANNWNLLTGNGDFDFDFIGVNNTLSTQCLNNPPNMNPIAFAALDGPGPGTPEDPNFAAITTRCWNGSSMTGYGILMDGTENWSVDGTPSSNEIDFPSVAVHEFGHATGWSNHFSLGAGYCPENSSAQTMCAIIPFGTTYMRSLAGHDIHTHEARY